MELLLHNRDLMCFCVCMHVDSDDWESKYIQLYMLVSLSPSAPHEVIKAILFQCVN